MSYGISDIREIAEKFNFTYSITEFLCDYYGFKNGIKILNSLKRPVKKYSIRINTLKCKREDVIRQLKDEKINVEIDKSFKDIVYLKVTGPYQIPELDKYVIADKFRR
ncbi:MAG: hypothetical protein ACTSYR_03765 [Candidatus Odinarchaeia archaeon]